MHHNRGPLPTPGQRLSVHAGRQRRRRRLGGDAVQVGHRHPQQPLRADPGQRRLQLQRLVDRHRRRLRELQRVRPQLRAARHGRAQQLRGRGEKRHGHGRRRLLVPRTEQLRPQQRRGQLPESRRPKRRTDSSISSSGSATSRCRTSRAPIPASSGQFTTSNGNNMPILQFDNNEAYGAMQGGFTYWWVSSQDPQPYANAQESLIKNLKIWHVYNKAVYHYPSSEDHVRRLDHQGQVRLLGPVLRQRRLRRGLFDEGRHHPQFGYSRHGRGDSVPGGRLWAGTEPHRREFLSAQRHNIQVPTNGSVNGCWMQNKLVVITNTRFDAPPGRSLNNIDMVRDVGYAPECLSKLDEARVYAYNGVATDNFQIYHTNSSVVPRPPASCSPTTRSRHQRPALPDRGAGPGAAHRHAERVAGVDDERTGLDPDAGTRPTPRRSPSTRASAPWPPSGTRSVTPTATTTYTITATNSVGSVTATATVTV